MQLFITLFGLSLCGFTGAVGPVVRATQGEVWPKPQQEIKSDIYFTLSSSFQFETPEEFGCASFLNEITLRYYKLIFGGGFAEKSREVRDGNYLGVLERLKIHVEEECLGDDIYPSLGDNEKYNVTVDETGAALSASSIWGVLRGLETFSQLIYKRNDELVINTTVLNDFPRFPHRGLLIDTSRHFQPVSVLLKMLDAMSYNKLNVFHWHLTDDESFPYKSKVFPELSNEGAYHRELTVYQQSDIAQVIEYARQRGIRVIPEFDTPGHTNSWGVSHPELLTECYDDSGNPTGQFGPMNPTRTETFDFLKVLFNETVEVFPDSFFHIGGDEVDFTCWANNPEVATFMEENKINSYEKLESYFIENVIKILGDLNAKFLVWQEVFDNGVTLPNSTVVHVWESNGFSALMKVVDAGKQGIFSSCWYLSDVKSGGDWSKFYICEPLLLVHGEEKQKLVLGGEACMWGEHVNEFSIIPRVWPRASAVAERLWSDAKVKDLQDAAARLEEQTCRMIKRGIGAQPPNGASVCL